MVSAALPPSTLGPTTAVLLILAGLVLGLVGRALLRLVMALVGALVGGTFGFLVGQALGEVPARVPFANHSGLFLGIALAAVGAIIGAILLGLIAKVGLSFLLAVVVGSAALNLWGSIPVALLAFIMAFALAYIFIDQILGVVMAIIGGILVASGMFILVDSTALAAGVGIVVALFGAAFQTLALHPPRRAPFLTAPRRV